MYKIGIIGFGTVGKSVLTFLNGQKRDQSGHDEQLFDDGGDEQAIKVQVWDARSLSSDESAMIKIYGATLLDASSGMSLPDFIQNNDFVLVSPGVDVSAYQSYADRFLCELDFFSVFFKKPVISVTGSLGKTTTCKLITKLLMVVPRLPDERLPEPLRRLELVNHLGKKTSLKALLGGNVGVGMLDLIKDQAEGDLGVLELSSYQLEFNKKFAPDIAVWTNFFPNHLDRHKTMEAYFEAKFNELRFQHERQIAILSADLLTGEAGHLLNDRLATLRPMVCICSAGEIDAAFAASIKRERFAVFFVRDGWLVRGIVQQGTLDKIIPLVDMRLLPDVTFTPNWVQILTVLNVVGIDLTVLQSLLKTVTVEELLPDHHHRLEWCATIDGVDFYNDSKSTVMQATQAAVERLALSGRPIITVVGGKGKGVDRRPLMRFLESNKAVKKVYCFGKDCDAFSGATCTTVATLEDVLQDIYATMQPGDQVLFSPSGSSFDLFRSYEHRGDVFKALVHQKAQATR
jgi:UDP-N-acetylmuramoylalanine--D-glutamate ligase